MLALGRRRRWSTAVFIVLAAVPVTGLVEACSSSSALPGEIGDKQGSEDAATVDHTTPHESGTEASTGSEAAADAPSDVEAGGSCEGGATLCSGLCTNTQTDSANCGSCSHSCGTTGAQCVQGSCQCVADAGQALCGSTCVDILIDPNNCGKCSHICQEVHGNSSTCSAGACQPVVVASSNAGIWDLAVDSTYVWWTQPVVPGQPKSGALLRKAFAAGSTNDAVLSQLNDPRGIAVDNINVYWVDYLDTSVNQVKVAGGGFLGDYPLFGSDGGQISPSYANAIDVAFDANNIYWVSNTSTGCVLSVPIGNPAEAEPNPLQCGENYPYAIATDGTNVYWVDQGNTASNGLVRQMPVDGSSGPTTLSSGEANPFAIAVDSKNVYWVDNANPGSVKQVPIGGTGPVVTLAQNEGAPYGIAIDANNVYWTDFSDNTVNAVPIGGGNKTVYAANQSSPSAITVDQVNIYWVNHSSDVIVGVTK